MDRRSSTKPPDAAELLALRLYKRRNPDSFYVINVSKDKCIRDAQKILARRAVRERSARSAHEGKT